MNSIERWLGSVPQTRQERQDDRAFNRQLALVEQAITLLGAEVRGHALLGRLAMFEMADLAMLQEGLTRAAPLADESLEATRLDAVRRIRRTLEG